jgi:hypothetical protein
MSKPKTTVDAPTKGDLQVWWIPQIPGKAFCVAVESPKEAKKLLGILADYDDFQLKHRIKPDYSNTGGLQEYDGEEWTDWYDENGDDIDQTELF